MEQNQKKGDICVGEDTHTITITFGLLFEFLTTHSVKQVPRVEVRPLNVLLEMCTSTEKRHRTQKTTQSMILQHAIPPGTGAEGGGGNERSHISEMASLQRMNLNRLLFTASLRSLAWFSSSVSKGRGGKRMMGR